MSIQTVYAAESWDKVYTAFSQINFTSFDFDTVKESLLQYIQIYYSENYNDFIESSELIALLELFAYAAELISYRADVAAHENFISTAQRKQSILRLAKLISYGASRNIPARGLVKITTVQTDQTLFDSLGNNLANQVILWNDPNNKNWKEQFFLVMNAALTTPFGQPSKSFQISDVLIQLYTINNQLNSLNNGVFAFNATTNTSTLAMECVPIDIDANGPFERPPESNAQFNIAYATDGRGDGSDFTGFLMFVKQGTLLLTNYTIQQPTANRRIELSAINVNDTDVWVYQVNNDNDITQQWISVNNLADQTLAFNDNTSTRFQYQIETLENDQIALLFGDGNFNNTPVGNFQLWTRVSANQDINVPKSAIQSQAMSLIYTDKTSLNHNLNMTFSLTSSLQNNSASETIEHVRQAAPSTHYAQNRMVNGQDYNTFMLKDQTILKLNTINRTFAGQPKYIEWNDASGAFQNIKLFGDDLIIQLQTTVDLQITTSSSRGLIDSYISPLLQTDAIFNTMTHIFATTEDSVGIISYPRRIFIEDNRRIYFDINGNPVAPYGYNLGASTSIVTPDGSLLEKTMIQGALDQHWYGEPLSTVIINGVQAGIVPDPVLNPKTTDKLYVQNLPRTIDSVNLFPPGDIGSGLQTIQPQKYFGLRFNRFLQAFGSGDIALYNPNDGTSNQQWGYGDGSFNSITNNTGIIDGGGHALRSPANGLINFQKKIETLTIEMGSDNNTFTIISSIRGKLPNYILSVAASDPSLQRWSAQANTELIPCDFIISSEFTSYEAGDAFVIDITFQDYTNVSPSAPPLTTATASVRSFGNNHVHKANLNGWWQLIPNSVVFSSTANGGLELFQNGASDGPNFVQQMTFDQSTAGSDWVFLIARTDDSITQIVQNWSIYNRDMKIIVSSPTTKFWFNQNSQITDPQTLLPVYDKIRILRSNLDASGNPINEAGIYDVVDFAFDQNGTVITNSLEVLPTESINFITAGSGTPGNMMQFENFAQGSYQFSLIDVTNSASPVNLGIVSCNNYIFEAGFDTNPYDSNDYDTGSFHLISEGFSFTFTAGNFMSSEYVSGNNTYQLARQLYMPTPAVTNPIDSTFGCNLTTGLDFMWQHFTPDSNLIDPSVSNIHDAYILTKGYYTSVQDFINGITSVVPIPPTPLDLRTSYGYLLAFKMLSDTVVLRPGKIKLLFGSLADQTLQANFVVVIAPTATFSSQRIQQEVINVINKYFQIQNWDFGKTFYATELTSLIHQALPTQISSVVLVPTYSVNTFGALFTIEAGIDEVLQSCATISNVKIVTALTSAILRQS